MVVYKTKSIHMMIRTLIFYLVLTIWTIFMGICCLPYILFPSSFIRKPAKLWIKGIFILLKLICRITYEIKGLENIPEEPVIIVSKHQSAFETFALFYYIDKSFFIHKKQLFYIPIFGQYLYKSNMVSINRLGKASAMRKMLKDVESKLNDGSSIIIFPEGTRKIPGEKPDYKTGFLGIYKIARRKLLPIALNSGTCWPKNDWNIKNGHIIIQFLPTIEPYLRKEEVFTKVKNSIEDATNKLLN